MIKIPKENPSHIMVFFEFEHLFTEANTAKKSNTFTTRVEIYIESNILRLKVFFTRLIIADGPKPYWFKKKLEMLSVNKLLPIE